MCIQPAIVQGFLGAAGSVGQLNELGVMGFSKFVVCSCEWCCLSLRGHAGGCMRSYFVAQIQIHDTATYQKYLDSASEVFSEFNGRYLAVDSDPQVLEGSWNYTRIVMIEFESEKDLRRWYDSPAYQAILQHRLKAASCDTLVVKGLQ